MTGNKTYEYDVYNRLIGYEDAEGVKETYTYDAEGVRRSKTTVKGDEISTIFFVSDTTSELSRTLVETDADGNLLTAYTWGDTLLSQNREAKVSTYLYDGHGDVRGLLNEKGELTDTYSYNAYGELISRSGETENHYLYTGEYYDSTTNLYYLRARYMKPNTGTFISMDTYKGNMYEPVTLHKYLYANANPVKYTDPSGNMAINDIAVANAIRAEYAGYNTSIAALGMKILSMTSALSVAVYVIEVSLAERISNILTEAIYDSDCSIIYQVPDVVAGFSVGFLWPWQCEKENEKDQSLALENKKDDKPTYYHATSKENAIKIMVSGILMNGSGQEGGYVFAWRNIPNKKALRYSGAQESEVIIQFKTYAAFENDPAFYGTGQKINASVLAAGPLRSVFP